MKLTYKKAITFFLVFIIVISYQAVFISCGDTAGVKDYKVIILDKSELELREVYSIECNGKSDAWIGGYILSGKPFPDKVEKASLGSVNRQYYKITEKVYDMVNGKYLNTTVPSEAIYATPAYMTEYNMPLYVGGISLFKLQFNCLVTTEAGEEKLAFSLSDQEIREAIESALGSTYAWDTFNKFEIQFIEELKEDFASSLGAGTAKAIWSTEYNGCEVENRLEITLQFADVDVAPRYVTFSFDLETTELDLLINRKFKIPQRSVFLLQQLLHEQDRMDKYSSDLITSLLTQFLIMLLRSCEHADDTRLKASNSVHSENEIIRRAQQYVSSHIREKLSVPTVARMVDVSPSYLTALFHKNLQISPGEYIRRIKLQESKQMIRENSMNFSEIAATLKYSTVHHFSRQFKDKFGITPTEYAKSVRSF